MIEVKDIHKKYKNESKKEALKGISLSIKDGELVAIVGASGSGKSTLLNILGGMDCATKGEYYFDNLKIHEFGNMKRQKFCRNNVSFIFQDFALLDDYSVYENVELPLIVKHVKRKRRKELVNSCLDMVGITSLKSKFPTQISGGEAQRCAIARAIASGNKLILADEPTGSLDVENGKRIMELLKGLNDDGRTVIIVTHNPEIADMCDRRIVMSNGLVESAG